MGVWASMCSRGWEKPQTPLALQRRESGLDLIYYSICMTKPQSTAMSH